MARCIDCNAVLRRGDTYHDTKDGPVHDNCRPDAAGALREWAADNGEADDAEATAAGDAA